MMTMMGNEGNEGIDVIEDIDVLRTCHILLPYPNASAYALAPYYPYPSKSSSKPVLRTGTILQWRSQIYSDRLK